MQIQEKIVVINKSNADKERIVSFLKKSGYRAEGVNFIFEIFDMLQNDSFVVIVFYMDPDNEKNIETVEKIRHINSNNYKLLLIINNLKNAIHPELIRDNSNEDYIYLPDMGPEKDKRKNDDFIDERLLLQAIKRNTIQYHLEQEKDLYQQLATYDLTTSLYNHRYFHVFMKKEINRSERYQRNLSLMFVDFDSLKFLNETFGQTTYEAILRQLSQFLKTNIRFSDLVFRCGEEKFAIVFPEVSGEGAQIAARRLYDIINKTVSNYFNLKNFSITINIGISTANQEEKGAAKLIINAELALVEAKKSDTNKIYMWNEVN